MANEAEQAIYQRLASAPLFHPASVELLPEDWGIETGDVVSVKSGEETYSVPVYSHTLVWNGKSKATIESTGNQEREPLPELRRKEYQQGHATYSGLKAQKQEIDEHWVQVTDVTDKGMSDAFGIIGVSIGADGYPVKDGSGNYVWDDSGTGGEIWGHLNRTAWSTQILNHIKDANGNIISLAEVYTDAYGNAIVNASNDQRTGTATINADRVRIGGAVTIGDAFGISNGSLLVKPMAIFGDSGNLVTINNGKVSADTVQINSTGSLKFGDGTGYGYRSIDSSTAGNLVTGFGTAAESGGQISIPYYTVGIPYGSGASAGNINFNIAATQFYQDGVAAAAASGAASHNVSSISSITLYQSAAGQVVTKYPTITYSNGDTTSIAQSVDLTGIAAGADASQIDLANASDIFWVNSGGEGSYTFTSLGNLGATIMSHTSDRGYVMFYARITGGTGQKLYGIPIG